MNVLSQPLMRKQGYIAGKWTDAKSGAEFEVRNPATGDVLARVADMDAEDASMAIKAACAALPEWRDRLAAERSAVLDEWYTLIVENLDLLADLLTREQGKPLAEARNEVLYSASFVKWYAAEARRIYGDIIPTHKMHSQALVMKKAVGVCAAITPWNFPYAMITRKVSPALAAGCTMIVKPASETPLCALALMALAEKAGMPAGVLNIVPGQNASAIGNEIMIHPKIRKVSFTGSTEIGRLLIRQSADNIKKLTLELGGHAPFIVFDDADIDKAVEGLISSKFRNSGQTCVCPNKILVQIGIKETFLEKLRLRVSALKVGNGLEDGTEQGPLIDEKAVLKSEAHIEDALAKGAELICGGKRHALGRTFFEPSILSDVTQEMVINQEETFGPVAPIQFFDTEAQAIDRANDSIYGLSSYLYTKDLGRTFRVVQALDYGMVGVNESILGGDSVPFGGVKQSGLGREGSRYGIEEYLDIKYALIGGLS